MVYIYIIYHVFSPQTRTPTYMTCEESCVLFRWLLGSESPGLEPLGT